MHLTWENEAYQALKQYPGQLEIVHPPVSIRAEPVVARVDANVKKRNTEEAAEAYLKFLYTDAAQEIIAKHFYRPSTAAILKKHEAMFPGIRLFAVSEIARDFADAHKQFIGLARMPFCGFPQFGSVWVQLEIFHLLDRSFRSRWQRVNIRPLGKSVRGAIAPCRAEFLLRPAVSRANAVGNASRSSESSVPRMLHQPGDS